MPPGGVGLGIARNPDPTLWLEGGVTVNSPSSAASPPAAPFEIELVRKPAPERSAERPVPINRGHGPIGEDSLVHRPDGLKEPAGLAGIEHVVRCRK